MTHHLAISPQSRALIVVLVISVMMMGRTAADRSKAHESQMFDLVVYGGTAGGVLASVSAAREGLRVALLEPGVHLGGMVSGGLGRTDRGNDAVIGGYPLEFFQRVGKRYGEPVTWAFEPHVAEAVMNEMVQEVGIHVFLRHRLREKGGVVKRGTRLERVIMENGAAFQSRIFVDASYEGDLMAQADVNYTWGREGVDEFNESLAGVRDRTPWHQFVVPVRAYDDRGRLLPEVSVKPKAIAGSADRGVQAYNFRLCMTTRPDNRVPFPRPSQYNPKRFDLLVSMLREMNKVKPTSDTGTIATKDPEYYIKRPWSIRDVMSPNTIKNGKTDTNNNGAFSTDYIGGSHGYPEGSYRDRARIWREHIEYVQGFLYFLAHDPRVPRALQQDVLPWGLCKDEFVDNAHWPHQLYIREARRMRGEFVMSQRDIQVDLTKPDPIGMGSYNSDSHNVHRVISKDGTVENEGDMQVRVSPYQIPYRLMLPKRAEATNLLVTVAFSATHVAYSTLRMEPQFMIVGHAAGVAAKMAISEDIPLQDIDSGELSRRLLVQRAVLQLKPSQ